MRRIVIEHLEISCMVILLDQRIRDGLTDIKALHVLQSSTST